MRNSDSLREISKDDADSIFSYFSNEDVTRYYGQDTLTNIHQAEAFVDFFANSYKEKREYGGELN
ncbi:GNAT family N-acetyltransferase [Litchfieldia alkalitelluris]|uniref:GNAT family N-acetyltransferase n=1 Tax=Litchfieldia alkalitelluris TaxID=304268 RepID=UPI001F21D846|nr:GNAT family N-acetyltransferase [Litchfieldia alkalitelluris]